MRRPGATPPLLLAILVGCGTEVPPAVGTLERDRIEVAAPASETIRELPVREGDQVAAGEVLARLDPARLEAELRRAGAARDQAEATLAEAVHGPRSEAIRRARADLSAAESALATAEGELRRAENLHARRFLTTSERDRRRTERDRALADRDAARAALDELLTGTRSEELQQAEAALAAAAASVARAEVDVTELTLRAPVAGRVDALPFEVGERPRPGDPVVVLLANNAPYARVYVPAAVRPRVDQGSDARVHVDGYAEPFPGRVRRIASEAAFTPFFALTERDRSRLVWIAEVALSGDRARRLPTGLPVEATFPSPEETEETDR